MNSETAPKPQGQESAPTGGEDVVSKFAALSKDVPFNNDNVEQEAGSAEEIKRPEMTKDVLSDPGQLAEYLGVMGVGEQISKHRGFENALSIMLGDIAGVGVDIPVDNHNGRIDKIEVTEGEHDAAVMIEPNSKGSPIVSDKMKIEMSADSAGVLRVGVRSAGVEQLGQRFAGERVHGDFSEMNMGMSIAKDAGGEEYLVLTVNKMHISEWTESRAPVEGGDAKYVSFETKTTKKYTFDPQGKLVEQESIWEKRDDESSNKEHKGVAPYTKGYARGGYASRVESIPPNLMSGMGLNVKRGWEKAVLNENGTATVESSDESTRVIRPAGKYLNLGPDDFATDAVAETVTPPTEAE